MSIAILGWAAALAGSRVNEMAPPRPVKPEPKRANPKRQERKARKLARLMGKKPKTGVEKPAFAIICDDLIPEEPSHEEEHGTQDHEDGAEGRNEVEGVHTTDQASDAIEEDNGAR
jgi:hypothetical protein